MREFLKTRLILDRDFYRKALSLLIPVFLQSVINQGVNMMDTLMVGRLGEVAISASSLANQFYNIYFFLIMGFSAAGLVLSAQYWGAGEQKSAFAVMDFMVQLTSVSALLFAAACLLAPKEIMALYTPDAAVIEEGARYLRITAFVFLPHGIALLLANLVRSMGNARLGLIVSLISFAVNIAANYIFIFGKLGMPAMGVMGAAVGTLIARAVEFITCMIYLFCVDRKTGYSLKGLLKPPAKLMRSEFFRLGMPAIISDTMLAVSLSVIGMILGHMGKEYVSAYSIVTVVDRMCTIAATGTASAAGVIVGQTVGAGNNELARRQGRSFLAMSVLIGLVGGVLILIVGEWSIGLYNVNAGTAAIAKEMMIASAFVVVFQNVSSTLGKGVLRGGGDTRFLMIGDVIFQWIASIPLGLLAGIVLRLPPWIVLISVKVDNVIKTFWFAGRLETDKWFHRARSALPSDTREDEEYQKSNTNCQKRA